MARPAPVIPINSNSQAYGMHAPRGTKVDVYNTPHARGRVVFIHGLGSTRGTLRKDAYKKTIDGLRAQGYQVLVPSLPYDTGDTQPAHLQQVLPAGQGATYTRTWERRFGDLLKWADQRYGKARTTVGGVSWGGLHTLIAAAKNPEVSSYFVHAPVVDPNQLKEFRGIPLGNLQMTSLARQLNNKPGFIGYDGSDTRVGVTPAQTLIGDLRARNAHLQTAVYPTKDHSYDDAAAAGVLKWMRTQRPVRKTARVRAAGRKRG